MQLASSSSSVQISSAWLPQLLFSTYYSLHSFHVYGTCSTQSAPVDSNTLQNLTHSTDNLGPTRWSVSATRTKAFKLGIRSSTANRELKRSWITSQCQISTDNYPRVFSHLRWTSSLETSRPQTCRF
jgi:hypothetical protein